MSEFEREDRYAVIKYKKLSDQQWTLVPTMLETFDSARVDCVVVEKDWPEYNFVWLMIEHRMAGYPVPDFNAVKCAADVAIAQTELETARTNIAQLQAEIERLKSESFESLYNSAIDEIERLKGGQGEPVAWMRKWAADGITPEKVRNENGRMAWPFKYKLVPVSESKCLPDDVALFASQTAPVPVVLPERVESNFYGEYSPYDSGWNACLDKVKELNQ